MYVLQPVTLLLHADTIHISLRIPVEDAGWYEGDHQTTTT
jgi:hypothetical protein